MRNSNLVKNGLAYLVVHMVENRVPQMLAAWRQQLSRFMATCDPQVSRISAIITHDEQDYDVMVPDPTDDAASLQSDNAAPTTTTHTPDTTTPHPAIPSHPISETPPVIQRAQAASSGSTSQHTNLPPSSPPQGAPSQQQDVNTGRLEHVDNDNFSDHGDYNGSNDEAGGSSDHTADATNPNITIVRAGVQEVAGTRGRTSRGRRGGLASSSTGYRKL